MIATTLGGLALQGLAGCQPGWLVRPDTPFPPQGWGPVLLQAGLTAALLGAVLLAWDWASRRRRLRGRLLRELRYFRHWGGTEGVLRKVGLIQDLNRLGVEPPDLEESVLAGADLKGARLRGSRLRAADLQGSDLQGALLDRCDLFGANLAGANLNLASLRGASLRGCNLEGASLAKAELAGANLHRANLVDANLTGTRLDGAQLHQARFASREPGLFSHSIHPSVEDWIRERLDAQGRYSAPEGPEGPPGPAPERPAGGEAG